MSQVELARLSLRGEEDVFLARQLGRDGAEGLGMERLDALRVATAISELGREIVVSGDGLLVLAVRATRLVIELRAGQLPEHWADALTAASRLVDGTDGPVGADGGVRITLEKNMPEPPDAATLQAVRDRLLELVPGSPAEELREQNRELLTALEQVRAQRAELVEVNRELEETNHGVLALYNELSEELDRTNQGVVALYAEIEDKNFQLGEASEAKSRFLRSISHELRTPVNSVLGLTGLLLDPRQPERLSAEHTEQVQYIRASAGDLQRLVDELLDLAKAESGRLEAVMAETSLSSLFGELRGVIEPILRPGVTLECEVSAPDVLTTDPDLLRHVLRNLLSNAAKFTAAGRVRLTASAEGDMIELAVSDTGLGISADDLPRIFEEFFQAASPLHAGTRGTGLGLPFAQVVAAALGGRIEVTSTVGEGSCFSLRLPLAGVPAAPGSAPGSAGAADA